MKLISLKCPECNANLQIEEGHDKCYCQYCGAEITINDYSSSHTYRKVDEARIKEAEYRKEVRVKQAEMDKDIRLKELDIEKRKATAGIVRIVLKFIAFLVILIIAARFFYLGETAYTHSEFGSVSTFMLLGLPIVLIFLFTSEKK